MLREQKKPPPINQSTWITCIWTTWTSRSLSSLWYWTFSSISVTADLHTNTHLSSVMISVKKRRLEFSLKKKVSTVPYTTGVPGTYVSTQIFYISDAFGSYSSIWMVNPMIPGHRPEVRKHFISQRVPDKWGKVGTNHLTSRPQRRRRLSVPTGHTTGTRRWWILSGRQNYFN